MHERRTHGSGRRLGAHRDADLAQILSVPSLSGGKKPVPPPKMVSENAQIRAGRRVNARSLRESARCVSHERETRFGFQGLGRMLTCLFGGRWMCVWKSEPIGGSKAVFQGSQSRPRTLLRLRSGDGSRSVWSSVGKIRFSRFGFGSRETLDEGSISHVRSRAKKFQRPRLFCNSRPQAARCPPGPRAEPTGARREEEWRATYSSAADESRRTRRATGSDRAPSSGLGPIAKDRRHRAEAATNNRGTWVSGAPSAARTCAAPRR